MTDKKFTDEEIIKALECHINAEDCVSCEVFGCCDEIILTERVLDLINRQKAEIERLKECPKCVYEYDGEITEYCVQGPCSNFKTVEQIKAEAYKEFAERLKNAAMSCLIGDKYSYKIVTTKGIDKLLKELVGDEE